MKKITSIIGATGVLLVGYALWSVFPTLLSSRAFACGLKSRPVIVAHRGGAAIGNENTLSCIEKGIQEGADMIEIDIHLTKDGQLVVCHDETIDRTTNGKGAIRDMTLDEIRQYRIKNSDGSLSDETLPTVEEVLRLVNGRAKMLIEIKRTNDIYVGIEEKLIKEIDRLGAREWSVVQSFNDSVLENMHKLDPSIRLEKLIVFKMKGFPIIFDIGFNSFSYDKYDYVSSFNFFYKSVDSRLVNDIHSHGKEIKVWTLGEPESTPEIEADGIITNNPGDWVKAFAK